MRTLAMVPISGALIAVNWWSIEGRRTVSGLKDFGDEGNKQQRGIVASEKEDDFAASVLGIFNAGVRSVRRGRNKALERPAEVVARSQRSSRSFSQATRTLCVG